MVSVSTRTDIVLLVLISDFPDLRVNYYYYWLYKRDLTPVLARSSHFSDCIGTVSDRSIVIIDSYGSWHALHHLQVEVVCGKCMLGTRTASNSYYLLTALIHKQLKYLPSDKAFLTTAGLKVRNLESVLESFRVERSCCLH